MNAFETELCSAFCGGLQVHPVPSGYAVSTAFEDASGDRITFYVVEGEDGFHVEDDGDYLATLIARDIPFDGGGRGKLLDAILGEAGAYWDRDTYEIRSGVFARPQLAERSISFLSALIRVRDLSLLTRDRVRSAFRDDMIEAIEKNYPDAFVIEENAAPRSDLKDYPADLILRPASGIGVVASVYLASTSDKLNEALLAWLEFAERDPNYTVVAMIEDADFKNISRAKYQRAQNRGVPMGIFRGDEAGAVQRIGKAMGMTLQ